MEGPVRRALLLSAAWLALPAGASVRSCTGAQAFGDSPTDNGNLYAPTRPIRAVPGQDHSLFGNVR